VRERKGSVIIELEDVVVVVERKQEKEEEEKSLFHSARKRLCASIYNTENLNGERSVDRSVGVDGPARIGSRIVDIQS
jgi:uncharacterized protein YbcI